MSDLISRQAAMNICDTFKGNGSVSAVIKGYIKALPPVEPKQGKWIYDRKRDWDGECKYECSECGMGSDVDYNYCMRCGAKMCGGEHE